MKFSISEFNAWENKNITLLGMSGVGKTYLSDILRRSNWFHYSGDYRIGTRYLDEPIMDMIKQQAMQTPFLKTLLRNDWISIHNNIKIHDLGPVLNFIGKPGRADLGGIELADFIYRQSLYHDAEVKAMADVASFICKAKEIYGYQHFVNDVGGSLCELDAPAVIETLVQHTLILYIQVTDKEEEDKLIQRAQSAPKPLYYRPEFLTQQLNTYLTEKALEHVTQVDPDDFTRWVFPRLFHSRVPRYEAIAKPHGYTVTSKDVADVRDEKDFLQLLESAITQIP